MVRGTRISERAGLLVLQVCWMDFDFVSVYCLDVMIWRMNRVRSDLVGRGGRMIRKSCAAAIYTFIPCYANVGLRQ